MTQTMPCGAPNSGTCYHFLMCPYPFGELCGMTSGQSLSSEPDASLCLPILPIYGIRYQSTEKGIPHSSLQIAVALQSGCR
jgi:hypothetical protein